MGPGHSKKQYMDRKDKIKITLHVTIFIILMCLITFINRSGIEEVAIGNLSMNRATLLGCVNSIMIILTGAITLADWKIGGRIAYVLLGLASLSALMGAFCLKRLEPIPGLLMISFGLLFIKVLRSKLSIIETNAKFNQQISVTDSLTGLTNRRGFRADIADMIEKKTPFYLLFLDLDDFKYVNDTIGHTVGDYFLQVVAKRLSDFDTKGGMVARNGGDEFLIVIPGSDEIDIEFYAKALLDEVVEPIHVDEMDTKYTITASVGVSHFPTQATLIDEIVSNADTAMYEAKNAGKNRVVVFRDSMGQNTVHDKKMEAIIKDALKNNRFFMEYQPQYEAGNKRLRGFEALIRLVGEDGKRISPAEFIPVAEKSDLILDIDHYVLHSVFKDFAKVAEKSAGKFVVCVNISAKHISEECFAKDLADLMADYHFPANSLEIEITEYCMIRDMDAATYTINGLSKLGVQIALDDFGTGYASLSNLTKLPIDLVKIDKSFIDHISMEDHDFVEAIIAIGHMMHCHILSEGVETEDQLEVLKLCKCDYIQGYLWGKPLSRETALSMTE